MDTQNTNDTNENKPNEAVREGVGQALAAFIAALLDGLFGG